MMVLILMVLTHFQLTEGIFQYFEEEKTWVEAMNFCHDHKGRLADGKFENFTSVIPENKQSAWTGRYTAGVWLWLTGCYDERSGNTALENVTNVRSMVQCVDHCRRRKGIALTRNRCYCLNTLLIKKRNRAGTFCDTPCIITSNGPCGGAERVSVYSFISDNIRVSYLSGNRKVAACGTARFSNDKLEFVAKECTSSLPALCKNGSKSPETPWRNGTKHCGYDLAVFQNENNSPTINHKDKNVWVGLVRVDVISTIEDDGLRDDWVDCKLQTKQGEINTNCDMTSGFICSLPQKTSTTKNVGKDGDHSDMPGSSTVVTQTDDKSGKTGADYTVLIACSATGVCLIIIVICACYFWQRKKRRHRSASNIDTNSSRSPFNAQIDQKKTSTVVNNTNTVHYSDVKLNEEDYDELPKPGEVRRANPEEEDYYDHTRNLNKDSDYDEIPRPGLMQTDADDTYDHTSDFKSSVKRANDADDTYDHTSHFQSSVKLANDADDTYDHTTQFQSSVKLAYGADDTYDHTSDHQAPIKHTKEADLSKRSADEGEQDYDELKPI